jgi:hypothetical protein
VKAASGDVSIIHVAFVHRRVCDIKSFEQCNFRSADLAASKRDPAGGGGCYPSAAGVWRGSCGKWKPSCGNSRGLSDCQIWDITDWQ